MSRIIGFGLLVAATVGVAGCTSAERSQLAALGSDHKVTVYSGGSAVREFHSSGKVLTESESDGWYFTDKVTGRLVRVSGTVVIEQE